MQAQLLTAATATNSAPSGVDAGVALKNVTPGSALTFLLHSTAGSGTMTVTIKLWGYSQVSGQWHPLGISGTAANKGLLNGGNAIGETAADTLSHAEVVGNLDAFDRCYAEITAIGGTATAVSAWLVGG